MTLQDNASGIIGLLAPYRVLDLTDNRAAMGPMMLGDLGADVIKVEPSGGLSDRNSAPLIPGAADGKGSIPFVVYNRGRRSVTANLDQPEGKARFLDLVRTADFLFESAEPGAMDELGLGFAELSRVNPSLVYVATTPFGQEGPYAKHLSTDLTLAAMGGTIAVNGEMDRAPVRMTVPQSWHHGASISAGGAMAAHWRRLRTGQAQMVDVSVQAATTWSTIQAMVAYAVQGKNMDRAGSDIQLGFLSFPAVFDAADGEVVLIPMGATLAPMIPWLVEEDVVPASWLEDEDWPTYDIRLFSQQPLTHELDDVLANLRVFLAQYTKAELLERGLSESVTVVPVARINDVLEFRHLDDRNYWRNVEVGNGLSAKVPGPFSRPAGAPLRISSELPDPGEHTAEVQGEPHQRPEIPSNLEGSLPFEGLKVADFSWLGVGPMTARYFADNGATVVRVEGTNPPDRVRNAGPFKDGEVGINRSEFFGMFNTSKKGMVLDLKHPAAKSIALKLLEWCDVAFESFTPGTMKNLGLDYEVARKLNPGIIMVSTCLMGQTGPASSLAGYGYHAAAISGFYEVTGWPDRTPGGPFTAYTDIIAPSFLTTTVAAAIDHHRRTGEGRYIEQAQMEAALQYLAPELVDYQFNETIPRRMGNADPNMAPHSVYPSQGDDQWIAIACETDEQWEALRTQLGSPTWAADPSLSTAEGRLGQQELLDREIGSWTESQNNKALMLRLQEAGVPAGVVAHSKELLEDKQLAHRKYFRTHHHTEMGDVPYEGHGYWIRGYDNGPRFAAPCLGEHTFEILTSILEMSEQEAAEALASGGVGA